MLECVINISEGRNLDLLDELAVAAGRVAARPPRRRVPQSFGLHAHQRCRVPAPTTCAHSSPRLRHAGPSQPRGRAPEIRRRRRRALRGVGPANRPRARRLTRRHRPVDQRDLRRPDVPLRRRSTAPIAPCPRSDDAPFDDLAPDFGPRRRPTETRRRRRGRATGPGRVEHLAHRRLARRDPRARQSGSTTRSALARLSRRRVHAGELQPHRPDGRRSVDRLRRGRATCPTGARSFAANSWDSCRARCSTRVERGRWDELGLSENQTIESRL